MPEIIVQPADRLLTEGEAAEILNCSVALLRKKRLHKRGPLWVQVGRLVRYSHADLMDYIHGNRVQRG